MFSEGETRGEVLFWVGSGFWGFTFVRRGGEVWRRRVVVGVQVRRVGGLERVMFWERRACLEAKRQALAAEGFILSMFCSLILGLFSHSKSGA